MSGFYNPYLSQVSWPYNTPYYQHTSTMPPAIKYPCSKCGGTTAPKWNGGISLLVGKCSSCGAKSTFQPNDAVKPEPTCTRIHYEPGYSSIEKVAGLLERLERNKPRWFR